MQVCLVSYSSSTQIEFGLTVSQDVLDYYSEEDNVPIHVGIKYDARFYSVTNTSLTITTNDIIYSTDQVAELSITIYRRVILSCM